MANMSIHFEEFGGIAEFSGLSINQAAPAVLNKAGDFLESGKFHGIELENLINWQKSSVDWVLRTVNLNIELNTVH